MRAYGGHSQSRGVADKVLARRFDWLNQEVVDRSQNRKGVGRRLVSSQGIQCSRAYRLVESKVKKLVRVLADAVERRESNRGQPDRENRIGVIIVAIIISLIAALDCGDPQGH